jgi:hypothetical protein
MANQNRDRDQQGGGGTMTEDDYVNLRLPREHATRCGEIIRNHLTEFPQPVRQEIQSQLTDWGGGQGQSGSVQRNNQQGGGQQQSGR